MMHSKHNWISSTLIVAILAIGGTVVAQSGSDDPVMVSAAVNRVRQQHTDTRAPATVDARTPNGTAAAALRSRAAELRTLGLTYVPSGSAFTCDPRGCRLQGTRLLLRVSEPVVRGDSALVNVEVIRAVSGHRRQPYQSGLFQVTLVRRGGNWVATEDRLRALT